MNSTEDERIDWSGIRAAAVAVGVREAARQAARDLPDHEQVRFVERVMKRCQREGWMSAASSARSIAGPRETRTAGADALPLSATVRNGADSMQNVLNDRHIKTRLGLSKWARGAAHEAATAQDKLSVASDVAAVVKVMDRIWPQDQGVPTAVINVAIIGQDVRFGINNG